MPPSSHRRQTTVGTAVAPSGEDGGRRVGWIAAVGMALVAAVIATGIVLVATGDPQHRAAPTSEQSSSSGPARPALAAPVVSPSWSSHMIGPAPSREPAAGAASTSAGAARPDTSPMTGCARAPSRCGLPDPTNTGVPAGTNLVPVDGDLKISKAGSVIEGKDINGCVTIYAANVTIRRSKIRCGGYYGVFSFHRNYSGGGLLIEDVEIDCGRNNTTGVASYGFVARRLNVHGCENGFSIDRDATVEGSYVHDFYVGDAGHTDGIQLAGGSDIIIRNNTIINLSEGGTSAIISPDEGISDTLVSGNLMAGGAYTLYCPRNSSSNFRVIDNRISKQYSSKGGAYGPWVYCHDVAEARGNVWDADGRPLE